MRKILAVILVILLILFPSCVYNNLMGGSNEGGGSNISINSSNGDSSIIETLSVTVPIGNESVTFSDIPIGWTWLDLCASQQIENLYGSGRSIYYKYNGYVYLLKLSYNGYTVSCAGDTVIQASIRYVFEIQYILNSFSCNNNIFVYESGSSWINYINSDYNSQFESNGNNVSLKGVPDMLLLNESSGDLVNISDNIIDNAHYVVRDYNTVELLLYEEEYMSVKFIIGSTWADVLSTLDDFYMSNEDNFIYHIKNGTGYVLMTEEYAEVQGTDVIGIYETYLLCETSVKCFYIVDSLGNEEFVLTYENSIGAWATIQRSYVSWLEEYLYDPTYTYILCSSDEFPVAIDTYIENGERFILKPALEYLENYEFITFTLKVPNDKTYTLYYFSSMEWYQYFDSEYAYLNFYFDDCECLMYDGYHISILIEGGIVSVQDSIIENCHYVCLDVECPYN